MESEAGNWRTVITTNAVHQLIRTTLLAWAGCPSPQARALLWPVSRAAASWVTGVQRPKGPTLSLLQSLRSFSDNRGTGDERGRLGPGGLSVKSTAALDNSGLGGWCISAEG